MMYQSRCQRDAPSMIAASTCPGIHGLKAGIEDHERERRDVPDAIEQHQNFDGPALREHGDIALQVPFEPAGQDAIADKEPTNGQRTDHRRDDEGQQRDEDHRTAHGLGGIVDGQCDCQANTDHQRQRDQRKCQRETQRLPKVDGKQSANIKIGYRLPGPFRF
jgi:hypothetical protein